MCIRDRSSTLSPGHAGFAKACGNLFRAGRSPKLSSILSPGPAGFVEACGNSPRPGRMPKL
eukprot:11115244-Alexandrium_andersonii.AAC.1